jgi:hypothetical protein
MTKISDSRGRILLLIFIMTAVASGTAGIGLVTTYRTARVSRLRWRRGRNEGKLLELGYEHWQELT